MGDVAFDFPESLGASVIPPINIDRLPPEIRESRRAVVWQYEIRDGKRTKVPHIPTDPNRRAAVDDPQSWGTMADAIDAVYDGKADGAGRVLGDRITVVDLDGCRDSQTGEIADEARAIITELDSYTEISPSGTGIHIWCRGTLPPGGRRKGQIEMYCDGRYMSVTGWCVDGAPNEIHDRTSQLAALHARIFGNGAKPVVNRMTATLLDLDDTDLIERAGRAKNGDTFRRLWAGDWSGYPSHSEADQALCNLLAFWTGADPGRIDALFHQSGLMREKWERADYRERTIQTAIAGCSETYSPQASRTETAGLPEDAVPFDVAPTPDDRLTEAGAAERFNRLHGDDVRFDHRRGCWLMWEGHRWVPDADAAVTRLALNFARTWQRDAIEIPDADRREKVFKAAVRLERRDALQSMLTFAAALKPIADAGEAWDCHPMLLGTTNGVIELSTGRLRAGQRDDRITMSTAVPFDPTATCPRWKQFLFSTLDSNADLIGFVQRAVGYSLTGVTSEQCLLVLYGRGANGKTTAIIAIKFVLGDYAWNMPFATIELKDRSAIPNDLAALVGRRFVVASETNDGTRLNESRVKALTGSDPVTARFLHREYFEFEPVAKFWLAVNHKPVVRDDSHGFWRRIRLIPFRQQFPPNPELGQILRAEAPGILAWAVEGCLAWQREGLRPPAVVTEATAEYEAESDPLRDFLDEAIETEPGAEVGARDLHEHYQQWAKHHRMHERDLMKVQMFGRKMGERFASRKDRTTGVKRYLGIARKGVFP